MPKLSVPEAYRSGIADIGKLSEEAFDQLFAALRKAPEFNDSKELSAWISNEVSAVPPPTRDVILRSITSMTRARETGNTTPSVFASDVWEALERLSPEHIEGIDQNVFENRVARLLEQTPIDLPAAKADDLKGEVERNYCDARILTDLRSGFRKTIDDSPSLMVVLHNLRISYHDDKGDHREFYVSMDAMDLRNLQEAVERAQKKAIALKNIMKVTNITVVE